jgi:hypothetical protein
MILVEPASAARRALRADGDFARQSSASAANADAVVSSSKLACGSPCQHPEPDRVSHVELNALTSDAVTRQFTNSKSPVQTASELEIWNTDPEAMTTDE